MLLLPFHLMICKVPPDIDSGVQIMPWVKYLLLDPCPQQKFYIALNVFFFLLLSSNQVHKYLIRKPNFVPNHSFNNGHIHLNPKCNFIFKASFFSSIAMTSLYFVTTFMHVEKASQTEGIFPVDLKVVYLFSESFTWLTFVVIVALEKRNSTLKHPVVVRVWWVVTSFLSLTPLSSFFAHRESYSTVEAITMVVNSLVAIFFSVVGLKGETGIYVQEEGLRESLLNADGKHQSDDFRVSEYANSSLLSRLTWQWLNPLFKKGYKVRLEVDDVPALAPEDEAQILYEDFMKNWTQDGPNKVRATLIQCFKKNIIHTGALALCRVSVMYVGPALITTFVTFKTEKQAGHQHPLLGYLLVFILLVSKMIDVLCSHHFNFQCQKLGMMIRSTLITVVYRKGLRLSNSARQSHGVGQIVNYMSVDVQQLSDVILQIHNLWVLPLQVVVALAILQSVVGVSMLAGLATMLALVSYTTWSSRIQKRYQTSVMNCKDSRMKATSEVLNSMKVIKLQAWEEHFLKRVESFRATEYFWIVKFMYQIASTAMVLWCTPSIVSVATFACCIWLQTELSPGKVFTATATFRILQEPVRNFPNTLIAIIQAQVSLDRLEHFLQSGELDLEAVEEFSGGHEEFSLKIENGSFTWEEDEGKEVTLRDINLEVKTGELVAVVGVVGSGKSSLLACVLGEMPKVHGQVRLSGSTAYVPQTAWIQNGTIEDNILFGQPMDKSRYKETMRVCALDSDMAVMDHGDQTEIGERGINLSGGQKQRIQLARAVYQDSDIYLLDDIFSAVDAHTGSAIFKDCVRGGLMRKTVILVTHQVEFLHNADRILVMHDGMIVQSGKYQDLLQPGSVFEALVAAHTEAMEMVESEQLYDPVDQQTQLQRKWSRTMSSSAPHAEHAEENLTTQECYLRESRSRDDDAERRTKPGSRKLIEDEERGVGRVSWSVYWLYLTKAFGWWCIVLLLICQGMWQVMTVLSDYWLAYETSEDRKRVFDPSSFICVYALLCAGSWVCLSARTYLVITLGVRTTQEFYLQMLRSLFRAPMSFFDTTPSGRILSRSSTDQSTLDIMLPFYYGGIFGVYFGLVAILAVMCQISWPIVFVIVPLALVYFSYQAYFMATSRELTRMDSITRAPIIHHFSESIAGFMVIRCFKKQSQFSQVNVARVNDNVRMVFHNVAANEWLGYRLEMIGTIVLCSAALLLVMLPDQLIPPQLVGLSLSYGLSLNGALYWTVWLMCMLENKMVSVERIRQYTNVPSEAPLIVAHKRPSANWPFTGTIQLQDLQLRYRPTTPLVLKGISLTIAGGEKVGVVGRTGSGKSTMIQALFRLVEPAGGRIVIDGVDIATLGLTDLRSKFGIIPQEPTLFEGTVRTNIDPLGHYSDDEIWEGLKSCQLADVVRGKPDKLDSLVTDDGDNWSVGQKQLFCLGRVLLKHARILFLDEATASVDARTDGLIQKTVREQFVTSTVISIAHRIPTVMDSNKVLVLDAGRVKEYDSPARLLEHPTSLFGSLVKEYTHRSHHYSG